MAAFAGLSEYSCDSCVRAINLDLSDKGMACFRHIFADISAYEGWWPR